MKKKEIKEKLIEIEMETRILTQKIKLIEENKMDTIEYKELERKLDVIKYGISIQDLINKL